MERAGLRATLWLTAALHTQAAQEKPARKHMVLMPHHRAGTLGSSCFQKLSQPAPVPAVRSSHPASTAPCRQRRWTRQHTGRTVRSTSDNQTVTPLRY